MSGEGPGIVDCIDPMLWQTMLVESERDAITEWMIEHQVESPKVRAIRLDREAGQIVVESLATDADGRYYPDPEHRGEPAITVQRIDPREPFPWPVARVILQPLRR